MWNEREREWKWTYPMYRLLEALLWTSIHLEMPQSFMCLLCGRKGMEKMNKWICWAPYIHCRAWKFFIEIHEFFINLFLPPTEDLFCARSVCFENVQSSVKRYNEIFISICFFKILLQVIRMDEPFNCTMACFDFFCVTQKLLPFYVNSLMQLKNPERWLIIHAQCREISSLLSSSSSHLMIFMLSSQDNIHATL